VFCEPPLVGLGRGAFGRALARAAALALILALFLAVGVAVVARLAGRRRRRGLGAGGLVFIGPRRIDLKRQRSARPVRRSSAAFFA
jgi:hypothetical protein